MDALIQKLVNAWGPSGSEHRVREMIREEVEALADEVRVDAVGNLICRVGSGGKRVMVAAHMDEIGLMPIFVEPSGYLRFENLGYIFPTALLGARVEFEDGAQGVVGMHDQWGSGRSKVSTDYGQFFIDMTGGDKDPAEYVGQPAKLVGNYGERGSRRMGRSMDDRIGCVVAIEAMRKLNKQAANEVYFVFTVQEELGVRGARPAATGLNPDVGIAVDVTATGDEPKNLKMALKLGEGTAIKLKDLGLVVPSSIRDWMVNTAEANNIPYQMELLPFGQTDAAAIHLTQAGVPSGAISIPCRYVHTVSETVDMTDVQASVDLLAALVANPIEL